jgi:DNA replication licensing factor MCM7
MAVDNEVMRSFIAHAQTFQPIIPADLHNYIVARYVEKRKFQREGKEEVSYMYITPRTLLGIIRISQAMAKFHFREEVSQSDVDEAIRLMDFSFKTLETISASSNKGGRANKTGLTA